MTKVRDSQMTLLLELLAMTPSCIPLVTAEVLEQIVEGGVLTKLTVSFSREEGGPKYVQDSLKEDMQELLVMWLVG
jgi:hypothetical protein